MTSWFFGSIDTSAHTPTTVTDPIINDSFATPFEGTKRKLSVSTDPESEQRGEMNKVRVVDNGRTDEATDEELMSVRAELIHERELNDGLKAQLEEIHTAFDRETDQLLRRAKEAEVNASRVNGELAGVQDRLDCKEAELQRSCKKVMDLDHLVDKFAKERTDKDRMFMVALEKTNADLASAKDKLSITRAELKDSLMRQEKFCQLAENKDRALLELQARFEEVTFALAIAENKLIELRDPTRDEETRTNSDKTGERVARIESDAVASAVQAHEMRLNDIEKRFECAHLKILDLTREGSRHSKKINHLKVALEAWAELENEGEAV